MRLAYIIVGLLVFFVGILLANVLSVPDAVNATFELINSEKTPDGSLRSGFDGVQAEILKGLKGLWSFLFGIGLTGLAYATKTIAWGAQAFDAYLEAKIAQHSPEGDPDDDWDLLEPVLLKAISDGDRALVIQLAEKMNGKPFMGGTTAEAAKNAKA